jgi:hypothetical protein
MPTSAPAMVFFAVIWLMAATLAVLAALYATRLPSKKKAPTRSAIPVPGDGSPAQPEVSTKATKEPEQNQEGDARHVATVQDDASTERRNQKPDMSFLFNSSKKQNAPAPVKTVVSTQTSPPRLAAVSPTPRATPATANAVQPDSGGVTPAIAAGSATTAPAATPQQPAVVVTTSALVDTAGPPANQAAPAADHTRSSAANPPNEAAASAPKVDVPQSQSTAKPPAQGAKSDFSSLGDFSDLFAKKTHEDDQSGKLAKGMSDVSVEDLLEEGRRLAGKLKSPVPPRPRK